MNLAALLFVMSMSVRIDPIPEIPICKGSVSPRCCDDVTCFCTFEKRKTEDGLCVWVYMRCM